MRHVTHLILGTTMLLTTALSSTMAFAQSAASDTTAAAPTTGGLDEIVVTAQRRAEKLQNVPISLTAFSPTDMEVKQINATIDLGQMVPNLHASNNAGIGTAATYYLRGLGSTGSISTFDPAVGTYVDEIYIPRQASNDLGFFDVAQLEVLRGPQGTLFGSNNTGGAVVITLAKPSPDFGGFAEIGFGQYDRVTGRASVDVPLSDTVLTKTSVYGVTDNGYARDLATGGKINATHDVAFREAIRFLLTDNITWDLSGSYTQDDALAIATYEQNGQRVSFSGLSTSTGGALAPYIEGDKGEYPQGNLARYGLLASHLTFDEDFGKIDIITGLQLQAQHFNLDLYGASHPVGSYTDPTFTRDMTFSQEAKFSGKIGDAVEYTTGFFFLHETDATNFGSTFAAGGPGLFPASPPVIPATLTDGVLNSSVDSYAVYGQADYHVTDQLTATLGLRYTIQDKAFSYNSNPNPKLASPITMGQILAAGIPDTSKTELPSARFALSYRFNPDLMTYVSATEGFKSGGWNVFGSVPSAFTRFGPEKDWTVEAGIRTSFLDNRVRLNATAFWMYDNGLQLTGQYILPNGSTTFLSGNYSDLENYGLEADAQVQITSDLELNGTLGLQDPRYTNLTSNVVAQQASCIAGVKANCGGGIVTQYGTIAIPQYAPRFTGTIGVSWTAWQNDQYKLTGTADVQLTSNEYAAITNDPSGTSTPRQLLDLGVTFEPTAGPWSLTVECKNCTYQNYSVYGLGQGVTFLNAPGYWEIKGRYRF
jgi:iron complex outermembrane recepter protein